LAFLVVAGAAAMLAACGSGSHSAAASASLRIDVLGFFVGAHRATLRCGAPGGNVPRPARACAELAARPELLRAVSGRPHSCPPGTPTVFVDGAYGGRRVNASFSLCVGGQEAYDERWLQLSGTVAARSPVCGASTVRAIVRDPISNDELQVATSQLMTIQQAHRQGSRCPK
jgi:hypothetical protein